MKPIIVVNFKTYKSGKSAVKVAKQLERADRKIIIGVQACDISEVTKSTKLKVYAQHVDFEEKGRATGFILPETVKSDGAIGTFLNHSEHKIPFGVLKKTMKRCREIGLKTLVFADSISEAKRIEELKPDYLAYEPPELVGGKISVSSAKPEMIKKIKKQLKGKFLVGAGIQNREDVRKAMDFGASGIAIASSIMLSNNPNKKIKEFLI